MSVFHVGLGVGGSAYLAMHKYMNILQCSAVLVWTLPLQSVNMPLCPSCSHDLSHADVAILHFNPINVWLSAVLTLPIIIS